MINFRFHVVSIVAVFLALAIGVVFGSTIVDRAVVDRLEKRLDDVDEKAEQQRDENEQLKTDIERHDAYLRSNAPYTVDGRMSGRDIVVLADAAVSDAAIGDFQTLAVAAGGEDIVVLRVDDDVLRGEADAIKAIAERLELSSEDVGVVQRALWDAIAVRLAGEPRGPDEIDAPADLLGDLADIGSITVSVIGDDTDEVLDQLGGGDTIMAIAASTSTNTESETWFAAAAGAANERSLTTVVGEFHDPSEQIDRGVALGELRNGDLASEVSTVDNLDEFQGVVSLVLAAEQLTTGVVGHYGLGAGATRSTPEFATE